jgi:outer membrane autotransporter protein
LDLQSSRTYSTTSGLSVSSGDSDGFGYGAIAQIGWDVPHNDKISFLPYLELEWSKSKLNAYQEAGGAFPAQYGEQEREQVILRWGTEATYQYNPDLYLTGRVALAHRVMDDGGGATASASGGLVNVALMPTEYDQGWGETGVDVDWHLGNKTRLLGSIAGRTGRTEEPFARGMIAVIYNF